MRRDDLTFVEALVRRDAAIVVDPGRAYASESRLRGVATQLGIRSITQLIGVLRRRGDSELERKVVEAFTNGETSFFRDARCFDALRAEIVPPLLDARGGALTIWSAASSSGQEAYSVAILLRESFPGAGEVKILATDLSRTMVERTRAGVYSEFEVGRGLSPAQRAAHLGRTRDRWRMRDELRAMVDARVQNLAAPWPALPRIDVLLLRNVLVYLDPPVREAILERARRVLAPDGVLVIGATESLQGLNAPFTRVVRAGASYYRPR